MLHWLRELFEILIDYKKHKLHLKLEHEQEMKEIHRDASIDILKQQVEIYRIENNRLLNKLINPISEPVNERSELEEVKPRNIPWNVRRQMLEKEDREKARLMQSAPKPDTDSTRTKEIEELEKEIGVNHAV